MELEKNIDLFKANYTVDSIISNIVDKKNTQLHGLVPTLFGASAFQYLNAGCELGLFDLLYEKNSLTKEQIASYLKLEERAIDILLLGTTSLNLTVKENNEYKNSLSIMTLFQDKMWEIFKDIVAFEQYIVYISQVDFVESLRTNTNIGLKRIKGNGRDLYHRLSENQHLEKVFYDYMNSWTRLTNTYLFKNVDFKGIKKVLDMGGGTGINAIALAQRFPHIEVTVLEIPASAKIARSNIEAAGVSNRVKVVSGDMFIDALPSDHDCILFSHQLVIWTPEENLSLLKRAFQVLPEDGQVIIFNSISNDDGAGPLMAALDSVYFATLPAEGGMIYAWYQYEQWLKEANFRNIQRIDCHGWTPHGIIQAFK